MEKHEYILIVDDDKIVRESLFNWFEYEGYKVDKAENGSIALEKFGKGKYDLALLDMKMPGIDGLDLLKRMKKIDDDCVYILITAYASIPTAVKALKDGANDYITKPIDPDELSQLVRNVLEQKSLEKENRLLKGDVGELLMPVNLASKSKQMRRIKEMVYTAARTDSTVLLTGERGSGKELVAKTIHINSKRKQFPFIIVDCETLSESSFKKDLLGFEKLEQNKNVKKHKGKFELAKEGSIFFKNINFLQLKLQEELLNLISEDLYLPVGSKEIFKSNFRIIVSTSEHTCDLVKKKNFNKDLYNKLNKLHINIPPLRERPDDIPILTYSFFKKHCSTTNKKIKNISPEALKLLQDHDWSDNVRELKNTIERAVDISKTDSLLVKDFQLNHIVASSAKNENQSLDSFEKKYVEKILIDNNWNISKSSKILNIDRATLYNKIKKYNLSKTSDINNSIT